MYFKQYFTLIIFSSSRQYTRYSFWHCINHYTYIRSHNFKTKDFSTLLIKGPRAIRTSTPPRVYDDGGVPFSTSLACATIRKQADKAQEEDEEDEKLTSGMQILVQSWHI